MFPVTFLSAEPPLPRAGGPSVRTLGGRRLESRWPQACFCSGPAPVDLLASSSESRTVCRGSVSAVGALRPLVQRERRERAGRRGWPLTLRPGTTGTSVSGSFSARILGLDLHVPPGARPRRALGIPTQLVIPAVSVRAWRGGQSLWPLPPGRLSSGSPEPARWCGLLRVGPSPAFDSELLERERRQVLRPQSDPLLQKPDAVSSALE